MVVVALLAGCAAGVPAEIPEAGEDDVWVVGIGYPQGEWAGCFEDDSVAEALMTADMPASSATATFTRGAREEDVRRVLGCLDRSLTGGAVTVTTRSD
ncbi:hypothetical protein [Cellulomonas sp. KRMCY2]|uniref:hypothetical protein n=1 Tax=Cellulomonas sp. KRMCY2 TaxID=1304865 RepID=UPI00045E8471|nr:hypothetical protein [Cellulomonas sp. KRMCY2]